MIRAILGLLFLAAGLQAATCAAPTLDCSVGAGQSVTLTSGSSVAWALLNNSVGSISTVGPSTSTVYTAPATIDPARSIVGGCLIQPNDSIFTTRIDSLPVNSQSGNWITAFGGYQFQFVAGWDVNVVDNSVNTVAAPLYHYTAAYNSLPLMAPNYPGRKREEGALASYFDLTDHHMVSVNHQTCQFQETYQDVTPIGRVPGPNHALGCNNGLGLSQGCDATSGWQYLGTSHALPTNGSTDAAGLPLEGLTLRAEEIRSGYIGHALRYTTNSAECNHVSYLWPGQGTAGNCGPLTTSAPSGARFRMKSGAACPSATPAGLTVCTALKQFGVIWADITAGSNPQMVASTDVYYDPAIAGWSVAIPPASMEAVDESSLMLASNSNAVNPANPYVIPSNSAVVSINGGASYQPITLTPVVVGVTEPYLAMPAGATWAPSAWVSGTATTTVSWTATGGGSFSGGVYTAPALSPGASAAVTLKACSTVNATSCAAIHLTVMAAKCKSADSTVRVCIDSGSQSTYGPDASGDSWTPDTVVTGGKYGPVNNNAGWQYETDGIPMETWLINDHDIHYQFVGMPAGNYKITVQQGQGYAGSGGVCNFYVGWPGSYAQYPAYTTYPTWNQAQLGPAFAFAQDQVVSDWMDPSLPPINNGAACFTRSSYSMPATVATDGNLIFGLDGVGNYTTKVEVNTSLATVKIEADATAPHLAMDLLGKTDVLQPGGTLQMNVVWWYVAPVALTWATTGPGTISQSGLYTAPLSQAVTVPAIVTASDGNGHSVSQTLWVQGASVTGFLF